MTSSFNGKSPMENQSLLLQSLMGKLQIRPSYLNTNSFLSESLEDFLSSDPNLSDDDDEEEEESDKTHLAKEESKLEKEIIRRILTGKADSLKPNSGDAVTVGEHHICVGFHEEPGSDYRVWEWHGHIMLLDEENGYTPEYIYGNYFERVAAKERTGRAAEDEEEKDTGGDVGLRGLIADGDLTNGRIVRRNLNVGSPR
ncbi:hypothetical protein MRB53_025000 [Persea americana]|uniref:Uncharacterized protein n=1 Tax=Persea americana TaxID=3435 RepID=A0ACC2LDT4_PERAE|nr:hypothetical protein MRB53_025000 [Persea americana]|eukprot:TRINITY_DN5554_c0_g1_i1.p2 TRINITY_DN5554_c0_g1~~TRINITY_DN5554_c0_g1_i1.p2  ORF type:complete len:199 (-),score=42.35 TRINITY_DN5554_c0_g1_i1:503-1099(-)